MCCLRFFEIYIEIGSTYMSSFNIVDNLSFFMGSLCISNVQHSDLWVSITISTPANFMRNYAILMSGLHHPVRGYN